MPSGIRVIGLTGGVATGKSSVAMFFAEQGVPIVDADQLARDAVLPGTPALAQIVSLFGRELLTQEGGRLQVGDAFPGLKRSNLPNFL